MTDPRPLALPDQQQSTELARQWRALARAATFVAILTSPAVFVYLHKHHGWSLGWSIVGAIFLVAAFRGFIDLVLRRFLPWPSLFGTEDARLREEDVINRRRASFWGFAWRLVRLFLILVLLVTLYRSLVYGWSDPLHVAKSIFHWIVTLPTRLRAYLPFLAILPFYFIFNFVILMGPMLLMGISQIRGFEPGDADWGVKLDDVRGQKEAKEEVRRIVSLWQSGEHFEQAGGKRERGLLFLGAPGTGKTMLAKAIATGFNCPFISIPGSGFAQAQPLDAKILTPRGWTTMGAIDVGDEVIDPEGGTAHVTGVFPQGERDIYRVTFSDGSTTECDLDHLWQVRRHRNRRWSVETLGSIKERLVRESRQNRPYIPLVENLEFEEGDLPLDPYLLGVLLGDGCFTTTTPALIAAEPELAAASVARLPAGMWAEENAGKRGGHLLTAGKRGRTPNPLTSTLKLLGLYGHGALTKFVPDVYKYASSTTRLEVLRGLMDTDGCVRQDDRSEAIFATSSPALADDVIFLVRSLGGIATKRRIGRDTYAHPVHGERRAAPAWQVRVALGPDCNPFRLTRKRDQWTRAWEPSRRIVSIEKVGRKQAQCIKLDSENELYVTDNFIVTHNTFIGIDAIIVRWLARKAKKMAAKWGGQCIVFIDEIDAVGMRRSALGAGAGFQPTNLEDFLFYGPNGALNPSGDLILETRAWREKLFAQRAPESRSPYPRWAQRVGGIMNQAFPGGMMGGTGQLALNQLLITMDGVDTPPFMRRVLTNKTNQILDALYIVPTKVRGRSLRLPKPKPRRDQIYFIGATNVPIDALDPALTRPGRMGRHVWFRTPTKQDRLDIFDLYLAKVAHDEELDRPQRRDEIARITNGYSPAMIDQVCSLALTYAHFQGRGAFEWDHIVEAMTTLESGTAIGIDYVPGETRAVAIHEAGHAVAGHVYMKGRESTRLSIRMRGSALGHHQALEKEERFSRFRSEEIGLIIWGLGSMAAERIFYGENTNGVGGDLQSVTAAAAWMVGASGMGPERVEIDHVMRRNGHPRKRLPAEVQRTEIMRRFEEIGIQIMNRASNGDVAHNAIASVLSDRDKRRMVAQILGQAYMKAHHLILHNKGKVEDIANVVIQKKEIYGDELVSLLNGANLQIPGVDLTDEKAWPAL